MNDCNEETTDSLLHKYGTTCGRISGSVITVFNQMLSLQWANKLGFPSMEAPSIETIQLPAVRRVTQTHTCAQERYAVRVCIESKQVPYGCWHPLRLDANREGGKALKLRKPHKTVNNNHCR